MRETGFQVATLDDGAIDFDAYRAEAARLRADAKRKLARRIAGVVARELGASAEALRGSIEWLAQAARRLTRPRQLPPANVRGAGSIKVAPVPVT